MFPILFEIGPLKINSYGLMIAVGFLTALFFAQRDAVKRGLHRLTRRPLLQHRLQ